MVSGEFLFTIRGRRLSLETNWETQDEILVLTSYDHGS